MQEDIAQLTEDSEFLEGSDANLQADIDGYPQDITDLQNEIQDDQDVQSYYGTDMAQQQANLDDAQANLGEIDAEEEEAEKQEREEQEEAETAAAAERAAAGAALGAALGAVVGADLANTGDDSGTDNPWNNPANAGQTPDADLQFKQSAEDFLRQHPEIKLDTPPGFNWTPDSVIALMNWYNNLPVKPTGVDINVSLVPNDQAGGQGFALPGTGYTAVPKDIQVEIGVRNFNWDDIPGNVWNGLKGLFGK